MDEQSTHQVEAQTDSADSRRHGTFGWFLWPAAVLLIYCLSVAPALKLMRAGILPEPVFRTVYAPLTALCLRSTTAGRFFSWYIELWHPYSSAKSP